jgi:hypothetical protein
VPRQICDTLSPVEPRLTYFMLTDPISTLEKAGPYPSQRSRFEPELRLLPANPAHPESPSLRKSRFTCELPRLDLSKRQFTCESRLSPERVPFELRPARAVEPHTGWLQGPADGGGEAEIHREQHGVLRRWRYPALPSETQKQGDESRPEENMACPGSRFHGSDEGSAP